MSDYFIYYTEASVVCIILFAIMLFRDYFNMDRQEKQLRYDHALIAFMLYFACDALWAAIIAGVIPRNPFTVLTINFGNYVLMAGITYAWLRYVMAMEQIPGRDSRRTRFAIRFPFFIATIALIVTYLWKPSILLSEDLELQPAYNAFQIAVPIIYIVAVIIYALRRARVEENPVERRKHLFVGFFPLMVIAGGLTQILLLPKTPIFCFCSAILMIVFYINDMETQISTDPLTGLNNRGQLLRYTLQRSNIHREGRLTFAIMIDVNDFKIINDTYGHAEGDRALLIIAESLRSVVHRHSTPMFLARYGGDEFTLIAHPVNREEIDALIVEIRSQVESACRKAETPYMLSIGAGYSELAADEDNFQVCMHRADQNLYQDKALQKSLRAARAH